VEKVIADILKSGKRKLVFDLSELVYMSSAGWGIFVGEIKTVRDQDGDIKIAAMSPEVYEVFQMLEFYHIIQDYITVHEAVMSFPDAVPVHDKGDDFSENGADFSDLLEKSGVRSSTVVQTQDEDEIKIDEQQENPQVEEKPVIQEQPTLPQQPLVERRRQPVQEYKEPEIDITKLPVTEKIKKVVGQYPLLNLFQIRKMLRHEKFGYTKIGILKLRNLLKILNLENRTKRYRYYRSV